MTIAELGALGEFVGSIVVILTLAYLAVQVRHSTSQQKREETISIHRGQNAVISQLMDPAVMGAYIRASDGDFPATTQDRSIAITWVLQYINHFQICYDLHHDGTLDADRYQLWEGFAVSIIANKGIRAWWDGESGKMAFTRDVRELIDRKLADEENPPVPLSKMWSFYSPEAWASDSEAGSPSAPR